jgi:uncharacterized protein YPO0396
VDQRSANDGAKIKRDLAVEVLKKLPTFDLIDMSAVNQDLAALERERTHLAKTDPEAAKIEKDLADAQRELAGFEKTVTDTTEKHGGLKQRFKDLGAMLQDIDEWRADAVEPNDEHVKAAARFFAVPLPTAAKGLDKWTSRIARACERSLRRGERPKTQS